MVTEYFVGIGILMEGVMHIHQSRYRLNIIINLLPLWEYRIYIMCWNQSNRKWLVIWLYKPPNLKEGIFINKLTDALEHFLKKKENMIIIGDFNMTPNKDKLQEFLNTVDLKNIANEPTCFKGKPSCIDLILNNPEKVFQKIKTIVTGI